MAKDRMKSVDATVKRELANLVAKDVAPGFNCLITLTGVKTSPDLRHCQVFISVMGTESQKKEVMDFFA